MQTPAGNGAAQTRRPCPSPTSPAAASPCIMSQVHVTGGSCNHAVVLDDGRCDGQCNKCSIRLHISSVRRWRTQVISVADAVPTVVAAHQDWAAARSRQATTANSLQCGARAAHPLESADNTCAKVIHPGAMNCKPSAQHEGPAASLQYACSILTVHLFLQKQKRVVPSVLADDFGKQRPVGIVCSAWFINARRQAARQQHLHQACNKS
jgi:hypothetical protein